MPNPIDFTQFKNAAALAEATFLTPAAAREQGRGDLAAELERIDNIILTYELRIADWRGLLDRMGSELGHQFVADALESDLFKLNHARMLRAGIERHGLAAA
ncbi:MAG: hypothetical protein KAH44_16070 [Oricola sp.]|jgi:hypothetical protein|nr:hypothetical protein [Oricola sp.]